MISALLYLQCQSIKNRTLVRLRRLKQPKYLLGGIVGGLYFYFYFVRYLFGFGRPPGTMRLAGAPEVAAADQSYAGIVYSRDNAGKWGTKVESHVPLVTVVGRKVTVTTAHPMSQDHYIVRHTLVLENGTVAGEKTYFPAQDSKAAATFEIPAGYKGKCSATSFCNLHDLWVTEINI